MMTKINTWMVLVALCAGVGVLAAAPNSGRVRNEYTITINSARRSKAVARRDAEQDEQTAKASDAMSDFLESLRWERQRTDNNHPFQVCRIVTPSSCSFHLSKGA